MAACFAPSVVCLVSWPGSFLIEFGPIFVGLGSWAGRSAGMVSLSGRWSLVPARLLGFLAGSPGLLPGAISELTNGGLKLRYCGSPLATRFPPWCLGDGNAACRAICLYVTRSDFGLPEHLPLPEGVDDARGVVRRRLNRKPPVHHIGGRVTRPPPKRRKWLHLPGPLRSDQEVSHIPRVRVG